MDIHFDYKGTTYNAILRREADNQILVSLNNELGKEFGSSLSFVVKNNSVEFSTSNRCHSDLFALNSSVCKAIAEQCEDLLS